MDPGARYLGEPSEEELCGRAGPVQEDLWNQSDGHLQNPQQTDGQVEAGRAHLEQMFSLQVVVGETSGVTGPFAFFLTFS